MDNIIRTDIFGWFDDLSETPAHDPGTDTNCPFCGKKLAEERSTVSLALLESRDRSYFYRLCRSCHHSMSDTEKDELDHSLIDVLISKANNG